MPDLEKQNVLVNEATGLCKYFELNVTLKLFGRVVWTWSFPPKKS